MLSDAVAGARRQVVVGRLAKTHNSESLKSSISLCVSHYHKAAERHACAPGWVMGRHRLPASLRRSTAAASAVNQDGGEPPQPHFPFAGPETWGEERNPRHRWVRKAARWARTYLQRPPTAGDR